MYLLLDMCSDDFLFPTRVITKHLQEDHLHKNLP